MDALSQTLRVVRLVGAIFLHEAHEGIEHHNGDDCHRVGGLAHHAGHDRGADQHPNDEVLKLVEEDRPGAAFLSFL